MAEENKPLIDKYNIFVREGVKEQDTLYDADYMGDEFDTDTQTWNDDNDVGTEFEKKYSKNITTTTEMAEAIYLDLMDRYELESPEEMKLKIVNIYSDLKRRNEPLIQIWIGDDAFIPRKLTRDETIEIHKGLEKLVAGK